jgi:hypothetical protein
MLSVAYAECRYAECLGKGCALVSLQLKIILATKFEMFYFYPK